MAIPEIQMTEFPECVNFNLIPLNIVIPLTMLTDLHALFDLLIPQFLRGARW
jgi:hypothetical protein